MDLSNVFAVNRSSAAHIASFLWILVSSHFWHLQLLYTSVYWLRLRSLVLSWCLFSGTLASLRNAPLLTGSSHYFRLLTTYLLISRSVRNSLKVIANLLWLLGQAMSWHKRHARRVIILILNIAESLVNTIYWILLMGPLWIVAMNIGEVSCWDSSLSD